MHHRRVDARASASDMDEAADINKKFQKLCKSNEFSPKIAPKIRPKGGRRADIRSVAKDEASDIKIGSPKSSKSNELLQKSLQKAE